MDYTLFEFLNGTLHHSLLDPIMVFITKSDHIMLGTFGAFILYLIYQKGNKQAFLLVVAALIAFALADSFCYRILKPYFGRVRPSSVFYFLDGVHQMFPNGHFLLGMKSSFSTPSNHAANMFAQATFWSLFYPKWTKILVPIAALVTYTRVYAGVHYPFDLFLGATVGTAISMMLYLLLKRLPMKLPDDLS